jgi:hypothetical protein
MKDTKPFDQLSEADQQCLTDIVAAMSVLIVRIPTISQPIYDYIGTEVVACRNLPANLVKYALRDAGRRLLVRDWDFTVFKRGKELTTCFEPFEEGDSNGEQAPS